MRGIGFDGVGYQGRVLVVFPGGLFLFGRQDSANLYRPESTFARPFNTNITTLKSDHYRRPKCQLMILFGRSGCCPAAPAVLSLAQSK